VAQKAKNRGNNMGIEQMDFLYAQSQIALGYLGTISGNITSALEVIKDKSDAVTLLNTAQTACVSTTELVNGLIPLITAEIEKITGDGKTTYIYTCSACSLKCKKEMKFVPPDEGVLKICELKVDESAGFVQTDIRVES
jgi:hypothetical protein